ncbi:MAG: NPCBM/NEW2 domain-containing protein [Planctomycetota bacterium]|mgnify:CR=1 FL=1
MTRLLIIPMLLAALLGPTPSSRPFVRIESLSGRTIDAQLVAIAPDGRLTLEPAGAVPLTIDDLKRIIPIRIARPNIDELPIQQCYHLIGGERITGQLIPTNRPRTLRVEAGLPKPLDIPMDSLAAVRFAAQEHPAAKQELDARLTLRPKDKDVLIVVKDNKPVVVTGALERITPDGIEFTIGRKTQKIALDTAYAAVFAGVPSLEAQPSSAVTCKLRLLTGSELPGRLASTDDANIRLDAGTLGTVDAPWELVDELRFRSERIVYLSDLRPSAVTTHSILDIEFPPRMDRSVTGTVISLRGRSFEKGIGTHSMTSMTFDLKGDYERFTAVVGIDDTASPHGSVILRVLADGRELFKSPPLHGSTETHAITVDMSGVKSLTLETLDAGDLDISDHADWADAMLIKARPQLIR